jgi:DNA (cytosine-5)-methyltransferase 1
MLKAIDFFCGGGGMSLGLREAGIHILAGIDNDSRVKETYVANHKDSMFFLADIAELTPATLAQQLNLTPNDDSLILVGCSPCQYWSLINTDKRKSKKTAFLLEYFQKHIEYFKPGFVLIENVPGLSLRDESPLTAFKIALATMGYSFAEGVVNCNDFGVPQKRLRYVLLASRLGNISLPKPNAKKRPVLRDVIGGSKSLAAIPAGNIDHSYLFHSTCKLSPINKRRIEATPKDGGTRLAWKNDSALQLNAYKDKDNCFRDVYARLYWDKPSPTITTKYVSYSNGRFGHPEQNRALSVREGALIQSFPNSYKIVSNSLIDAARIIGNAVPPKMALALGKEIVRNHDEKN